MEPSENPGGSEPPFKRSAYFCSRAALTALLTL
jgi:hypothetical protein